MSAPTEMELRRPEPDTWGWECSVKDCREPVPADVEDQPHCESCHVPVCEVHVVTRAHVHLCPGCYLKERSVLIGIAFDPNDVQFACERWMKEIGEVL